MLRSRGIPDLARKQAVPYLIECLDRPHTHRKSTANEWIVRVRPGCRPFWGMLFPMLDDFPGHQEYLSFSVHKSLSEMQILGRVGGHSVPSAPRPLRGLLRPDPVPANQRGCLRGDPCCGYEAPDPAADYRKRRSQPVRHDPGFQFA